MERARGKALELLFLINRGEVRALQRAGRSEGRISALLHDDLLDFILCAGACTVDSAVSECVSLLAALCVCCSAPFLPRISSSLVSDLVKCSRTAAWRVLVQLINNSDNMIYVIHSTHKITACNCFPNVFRA